MLRQKTQDFLKSHDQLKSRYERKLMQVEDQLALESATVHVKHGRVHAEDCEDCEQRGGQIHEFRRGLVLEGDLTDAQRQRMLEIADRCPVHQTLHNEIKVRTELR